MRRLAAIVALRPAIVLLGLALAVACASCSSDEGEAVGPFGAGAAAAAEAGPDVRDAGAAWDSAGSGGAAGFAGGGGKDASAGAAGKDGGKDGAAGGAGGAGSGGDAGDAGPTLVCKPSGGAADCSPAQPPSYDCADLPPNYKNAVGAAVQAVLAQHPQWFDFNQGFPCCPLAVETNAYLDAVVAGVVQGGLCAARDPNNPNIEIVVKHDNGCDEGYSILTSGNIVRNPPHYQGTCVPAWL
jgi:hypothetical protein